MEKELADGLNEQLTSSQLIAIYQKEINELEAIVKRSLLRKNHIKLAKLRAVRNYRDELELYDQEVQKLEINQQQLEKARQAVASVIWFFNNQELSTRALEKQDIEQYSHWFSGAKDEWNSFAQNHGGYFKAPDQPLNVVMEKTFKSEEPTPN